MERVFQRRRRSSWSSRVTMPLPLPCLALAWPGLSTPRVDDERLCDFSLQVQEEMSETLLRLQRSSCLPGRCWVWVRVVRSLSELPKLVTRPCKLP